MRGIPANAFFSCQQLSKCQTRITDKEARYPVCVEFTGFLWINNVASILQLHRCLGEDFEE